MATQSQIDALIRKAETGADWAEICRLEAEMLKPTSPALTIEPRTLDELLAELTAEHEQVENQYWFLHCGAGSLNEEQSRKVARLGSQMWALKARIKEVADELALRRAKASVAPFLAALRAAE